MQRKNSPVFPFLGILLGFLIISYITVNALSESQGLTITPDSHDFGNIVQNAGPVSAEFTVQNLSEEEIILHRLSTSCGCTTAEMDLSPLQPGQQRKMTVEFDPMVHPNQFGPIVRAVYLQSSDPARPEIILDITGNVTP